MDVRNFLEEYGLIIILGFLWVVPLSYVLNRILHLEGIDSFLLSLALGALGGMITYRHCNP